MIGRTELVEAERVACSSRTETLHAVAARLDQAARVLLRIAHDFFQFFTLGDIFVDTEHADDVVFRVSQRNF